MKELKVACYAAQNILNRLEDGQMIQRWQISAIVKAKEELASVYTSMSADEADNDEWEDEEEPMYIGFEYPSMYEASDISEEESAWKTRKGKWANSYKGGFDSKEDAENHYKKQKEFDKKTKVHISKLKPIANEEVELDEVSKKTLKSYIGKATDELDADWQAARKGKPGMPNRKVSNRFAGVEKAKKRMKEEADVDESSFVAKAAHAKVAGKKTFKLKGSDKVHPVTIQHHHARKIKKAVSED
jgi:hypothetical protein